MEAVELNIDGLVGPTHNYAGLSHGNLASQRSRQLLANPRRAALQGLEKMQLLMELGYAQAVMPPAARPDPDSLRALGFVGSDAQVLQSAARQAPTLLAAVCSASSMWMANACTVSPGSDTADGRVHFSVANLSSQYHRNLEVTDTARLLRAIFADSAHFVHHEALPASPAFGDEGAANHMRLNAAAGAPGVEVFVYGRSAFNADLATPKRYPARQTLEASSALARRHGLSPARMVLVQQAPHTIDQGVFHNDVIATSHANLLLYHEQAFLDGAQFIGSLTQQLQALDCTLNAVAVPETLLSVEQAVSSYLFNSQLLSRAEGPPLMLVPQECREQPAAWHCIEHLLERGVIGEARVVRLDQSMRNGGGPACLRLRVELNTAEQAAMHPGVRLTPELCAALRVWIERHYRDRLSPRDLADVQLLNESRTALDELTQLLKLGSVYAFQQC